MRDQWQKRALLTEVLRVMQGGLRLSVEGGEQGEAGSGLERTGCRRMG